MTLSFTYFGSSGWLVELGDYRVLIDPWLRGDLIFPPGPWLIKGSLKHHFKIPDRINMILLTQGLEDHAHPPTLKVLPRSTPVVGPPSVSKLLTELGFKHSTYLKPQETFKNDKIIIMATSGAKVPNLENGYIVKNQYGSFYIEPHGFLDKSLSPQRVDTLITPVINLKLPIAGSFIQGKTVLPYLIKTFNPLNILASTTGGDAHFSGLINTFITTEGTLNEAEQIIGSKRTFIDPIPGESYKLNTFTD